MPAAPRGVNDGLRVPGYIATGCAHLIINKVTPDHHFETQFLWLVSRGSF